MAEYQRLFVGNKHEVVLTFYYLSEVKNDEHEVVELIGQYDMQNGYTH